MQIQPENITYNTPKKQRKGNKKVLDLMQRMVGRQNITCSTKTKVIPINLNLGGSHMPPVACKKDDDQPDVPVR